VVALVSVLLGIAGLATAAVGVMAMGGLPENIQKVIDSAGIKIEVGEGLAFPIIAFGIILLIVAFLGCATAKFKNPCFAIPFGAITLAFGLALIIVAAYSLGGEEAQALAFNLACPPAAKDRTKLNVFDKVYNNNVDRIMCSKVCGCDVRIEGVDMKDVGTTVHPYNLDDKVLRTFGRTKTPTIYEK